MSPLRWGFLGASRIGQRALAPAMRTSGQTLVAVGARDLARAQAYADALGMARAHQGYEALVNDPGIDAVYIGLTNETHLPWTLRALAAGKHVLCEKPLALTAAEVLQMQAASRQSGRLVLEAFCPRFHPQFARAQQLVQSGALGRLHAAQAHFANPCTDPNDFRWTASMGGGALYDLGGYCISHLRSLLGQEPLRATATVLPHGDVDASLSGYLDFGNGLAASLFCSLQAARSQSVSLFGESASLRFSLPFSCKGRPTTLHIDDHTEDFPPTDPYAEMAAHFARAVAGEEKLKWGLEDSLPQARTLDALFASAKTAGPSTV